MFRRYPYEANNSTRQQHTRTHLFPPSKDNPVVDGELNRYRHAVELQTGEPVRVPAGKERGGGGTKQRANQQCRVCVLDMFPYIKRDITLPGDTIKLRKFCPKQSEVDASRSTREEIA